MSIHLQIMSKESRFREFFNTYYLPLSMFALRITGDADRAHDAAQEALTSLWKRVSDNYEINDWRAYTYRICRNESLRQIPEEIENIDNISEISEEEIETSERDARLWRAIENLPEKTRKVFLMSKRDGMKYREIAEELNISVKTVENQISNALSKLRNELRPGSGSVFFLPFL